MQRRGKTGQNLSDNETREREGSGSQPQPTLVAGYKDTSFVIGPTSSEDFLLVFGKKVLVRVSSECRLRVVCYLGKTRETAKHTNTRVPRMTRDVCPLFCLSPRLVTTRAQSDQNYTLDENARNTIVTSCCLVMLLGDETVYAMQIGNHAKLSCT